MTLFLNNMTAKNTSQAATYRRNKHHSAFTQVTVLALLSLFVLGNLTGCERTPPDHRAAVTLPVYTAGDAQNGEALYADACENCHSLVAGKNQKGPQLMNIYGAKAAQLNDYKYSEALKKTGWVWDANKIDAFITDAQIALPDTRMHSDPITDENERQDLITYLSTLREDPPKAE